jgi:uncharacterized protein GlcG (DUF336 family)
MKHAVQQFAVTFQAAHLALGAAAQVAQDLGIKVNIAIVDGSGVLAGFLRMPGAPLHSVDIALDKAYTAASFGLPTSQWTKVLKGHSEAVQQGLPARPRFVAFGGGLAMVEEGFRIGAIGVSGGSEEQDEQVARAGLQALGLAN